ncbi:hypothetical protein AWE51_06575 [Aquimarina aggregata]|uniref:SIMPL domain-containing protein n=1 Tax=Aquimarina aggregata TaxID=1642818 RepID=A0A163AKE7_9FLAO|nr:hypothetical protein [Aquimarina aggregata]KZS40608.1 hypothetical protein AWE51_06575 [Aquimarina aggregata]
MKKILYLILLLTNIGFAQNGFIEIKVKDSIRLKPVKFEYNVQISESKFLSSDKDLAKSKMQEKYEQLELFLRNRKYKIRPLNNSEFQIHDYVGFWKYGFAVELSNSKELENLTTELKKLDFIKASIGEIEYENPELSEKKLFSKLLKKAKEKGKMIAELTGQKLGNIIELKESKESDNLNVNIKDIYLASLRNKDFGVVKNQLFGQKWETIIVKFSAK